MKRQITHTYRIRKDCPKSLRPWTLAVVNTTTGALYTYAFESFAGALTSMLDHQAHVRIEYGGPERAKAAFPAHSNLSRDRPEPAAFIAEYNGNAFAWKETP